MAKQHLILLLAVLMVSILQAVSSQNNLPRGLLPQGVRSYVLHPGSALELNLPGECSFFVSIAGKQFQFCYASRVSGVIKIQAGFAWLGFNKVSRAGNLLNIQLEKSTQSFPVSAFAQSPRCN
ncbi:hypothetical protein SETIT_7G009500v2 [Setaria italica]|uniref:Xylanase inhibitor C-terminal domain-containing protein n=1 Tax=Setaria italica TaxID=4555 RepID=A0A368RQX9_SETIT|nr:hypothetical protein SETIT_7G009500v2 [Setaria italica]